MTTAQQKHYTRSRLAKAGLSGGAVVAYYATLLGAGLASAFPVGRDWGFNWWAYFPWYIPLVAFVIAAALPLILLLPRVSSRAKADISRAQYWLFLAGVTVVSSTLFILLRGQIHFLGDGYQQISLLSHADPVIKPREFGGMAIPSLIASLLGEYSPAGATLSYQIVSVGAGCLFVIIAGVLSLSVFERRRHAVALTLGLLSGGFMLLFFGYVENYSLFVVSVVAFSLSGILASKGRVSKWWLVLPFALSCFFHIFGLTLLPALLFLLVRDTKPWSWLSHCSTKVKLGLRAAGILVGAAVLYAATLLDPSLKYSLMAINSNPLTVEGYTLFSGKHLLDLANLIVLLVPGILVLTVSLGRKQIQDLRHDPAIFFLTILTVCALGTVFLLEPRLGMPRDWDVFSFTGIPLVSLLCYAYLAHRPAGFHRFPALALFIGLGWMALVPRVVSQVEPEIGLAHLHNYIQLDVAKNGPVRQILIGYYNDFGNHAGALSELHAMDSALPDGPLCDSAIHLSDLGECDQAIPVFRRVLQLNPLNNSGWLNLANCFEQTGQLDSALSYLKMADALNPGSVNLMNSFAWVYLAQKEYNLAEQYWRRALKYDRNALAVQLGLATLYFQTGRRDLEVECLNTLFRRTDLPAQYFRQLGDELLTNRDTVMAVASYELAIKRGLDSASADSLRYRFPQLTNPRP